MFWNQIVVMIYLWGMLMYTVFVFSFASFFSYVYSILPACMFVNHMYSVPTETRRE